MTECASLAVGISEDGARIWATARDADGNTVGTATLTPDCASFSVDRSWADGLLTVRIVQEDLQLTVFAETLTVYGDPARWDLLHSAPFLGERREHSVPFPAEWYGSRATYRMVRDRIADADENGEDPEYEYEKEHADDEKAEAMERIADILWLDGWTKDDREQLIEQYDLTADDADAICELLGKIEEAEAAEEEKEEAKEAEAMMKRIAEDEVKEEEHERSEKNAEGAA